MSKYPMVVEIRGEPQFEENVVLASHQALVMVDFWAAWCNPCRMLAPILEKVASTLEGKVRLAKVNTEEPDNQALALRFRIQGIPAVKFFRKGMQVGEFVGAQTEAAVRQMVTSLLPSAADEKVDIGRKLAAQGKTREALAQFQEALELAPQHAAAHLELAFILAEDAQPDAARQHLQAIGPGQTEYTAAQALLSRLDLGQRCANDQASAQWQQRVRANPDDLEARLRWGDCLAAKEQYQEALEEYLYVLKKNRAFEEDAARKSMLRVFSIIGVRAPLADEYRDQMAKVLF